MPTLLIGIRRISARPCTSSMVEVLGGTAVIGNSSFVSTTRGKRRGGPPLADGGGDCLNIKTGGDQTILARTMLDETIGNTQMQHGCADAVCIQKFADCTACTARNSVFFYSDEGFVTSGKLQ